MPEPLIIWTYDWVPDGPRGFVRDFRLRWACEEAGLDYGVRTVPFENRGPSHFARQPFGQVPFLEDDGIVMFESGAGLLHIAGKSDALMPLDPKSAAETLQWVIAALNSIEMVTLPWWFVGLSTPEDNPLEDWMAARLGRLETVLAARQWLAADRFTVADLVMADVLRIPKVRAFGQYPALQDYVQRVCARPAFSKARDDQLAHFAAADRERSSQ
ncbi:MAG: glutathione S-transferase family protein [Mesorhizobium sp.]|nr:glutathione S-transferase family protein [Mesorhizobium sp.]